MKKIIIFIIILLSILQFNVLANDLNDLSDYDIIYQNLNGYSGSVTTTVDDVNFIDVGFDSYALSGLIGLNRYTVCSFYDTNYNLVHSESFYFTEHKSIEIFTDVPFRYMKFYCIDDPDYIYNQGYLINNIRVYTKEFKFEFIDYVEDLINYKFTYKFNDKPVIEKSNILVKDNFSNIIDFSYNISDNSLIITPIGLVPGYYSITILSVTDSNNTAVITNIPVNNFTVRENFRFLEVHEDLENYIFTYKFSNIPSFENEDIKVLNSKNEEMEFSSYTSGNNIVVTPLNLDAGNYTIKINSVTNGDEEITNIKDLKFTVKEKILELTSRDFGYYILKTKKNFRLSFNKNILSADVKVLDSNDVELPFTKSFMYNNLFIEISEELQENKEYKIIIENASGENDYILKSPLEFEINTRSISGDLTTDEILNSILNIFVEARYRGLAIVILAITIGVIFIIAKWLWNKLKQWLRKI